MSGVFAGSVQTGRGFTQFQGAVESISPHAKTMIPAFAGIHATLPKKPAMIGGSLRNSQEVFRGALQRLNYKITKKPEVKKITIDPHHLQYAQYRDWILPDVKSKKLADSMASAHVHKLRSARKGAAGVAKKIAREIKKREEENKKTDYLESVLKRIRLFVVQLDHPNLAQHVAKIAAHNVKLGHSAFDHDLKKEDLQEMMNASSGLKGYIDLPIFTHGDAGTAIMSSGIHDKSLLTSADINSAAKPGNAVGKHLLKTTEAYKKLGESFEKTLEELDAEEDAQYAMDGNEEYNEYEAHAPQITDLAAIQDADFKSVTEEDHEPITEPANAESRQTGIRAIIPDSDDNITRYISSLKMAPEAPQEDDLESNESFVTAINTKDTIEPDRQSPVNEQPFLKSSMSAAQEEALIHEMARVDINNKDSMINEIIEESGIPDSDKELLAIGLESLDINLIRQYYAKSASGTLPVEVLNKLVSRGRQLQKETGPATVSEVEAANNPFIHFNGDIADYLLEKVYKAFSRELPPQDVDKIKNYISSEPEATRALFINAIKAGRITPDRASFTINSILAKGRPVLSEIDAEDDAAQIVELLNYHGFKIDRSTQNKISAYFAHLPEQDQMNLMIRIGNNSFTDIELANLVRDASAFAVLEEVPRPPSSASLSSISSKSTTQSKIAASEHSADKHEASKFLERYPLHRGVDFVVKKFNDHVAAGIESDDKVRDTYEYRHAQSRAQDDDLNLEIYREKLPTFEKYKKDMIAYNEASDKHHKRDMSNLRDDYDKFVAESLENIFDPKLPYVKLVKLEEAQQYDEDVKYVKERL